MGDLKAGGESCIRIAVEDDIPHLARHHRMMFEEIREQSRTPVDPSVLAVLEREYAEKLAREFRSGTRISWVADPKNKIVSSGAISIVSYVPVPHDPSCRIAFLHSIYTEKEFRHQHHARTITVQAADYCRNQGIGRMYLFASDAGRPLYEKSGFVPVSNILQFLP